jgi:hypothetical protein
MSTGSNSVSAAPDALATSSWPSFASGVPLHAVKKKRLASAVIVRSMGFLAVR